MVIYTHTHTHTLFQGVLYKGNVLRHLVRAGGSSDFAKYSRTSVYRHERENFYVVLNEEYNVMVNCLGSNCYHRVSVVIDGVTHKRMLL